MQSEPHDHSPLSSADERLLEEILTGARSPEDPEFRERLAASKELAQEHERLMEAQRVLSDTGFPHDEDLDEADASDADQVRDILVAEGLIETTPTRNWMAIAAMLMVFGGLGMLALEAWTRSQGITDDPGDRVILSQQASPAGPVAEYGEFQAPVELQADEQLLIHVYALESEGTTPLVSGPLPDTTWTPNADEREQLRGWPSIRWTYEIVSPLRPPAPVDVFARLDSSLR